MTKRYLSKLFIGIFLLAYGTISHGKEKELRVFYEIVDGECLFQKNWNKVSGSLVSWDISDLSSGRVIDSHSYRFLEYKPSSLSKEQSPNLRYFQIINQSKLSLPVTLYKAELNFLNEKKKEFGGNDLELAQLIYETDESTLARLNSLSNEVSFKKFSDVKVLIPGGLTVCKLKINTLMSGSKARFKTNLFGGVTIKSDETVSTKSGEKSFAVELFKRIY